MLNLLIPPSLHPLLGRCSCWLVVPAQSFHPQLVLDRYTNTATSLAIWHQRCPTLYVGTLSSRNCTETTKSTRNPSARYPFLWSHLRVTPIEISYFRANQSKHKTSKWPFSPDTDSCHIFECSAYFTSL